MFLLLASSSFLGHIRAGRDRVERARSELEIPTPGGIVRWGV